MRESILSKLVVCKQCRKAYIPNVDGDENYCDSCIDGSDIVKPTEENENEIH